jgi:hypothetical protein
MTIRASVAFLLLLLAGCDQFQESVDPGADTAAARAARGCASGQPADFLHQNRPGGSDYDARRCSGIGY